MFIDDAGSGDAGAMPEAAFAAHMKRLIASRMSGATAPDKTIRLGLACSGGLDSMALLSLAARWLQRDAATPVKIRVFHIHHGLSPHADAWLAHVAEQAAAFDLPFDALKIEPPHVPGRSIEEVARERRYAALAQLCQQHACDVLLCAHHQDDQAETVLMQMLRGAGVAGLRGISQQQRLTHAGAVPGLASIEIIRPLLAHSRATLQAYVQQQGVRWIEDESNQDQRYTRNALRHTLMPVLRAMVPGYAGRLGRTAAHMQEAAACLDDLAAIDWVACRPSERSHELALPHWRALPLHRRANLLRFWLHQIAPELRMPSASWLQELDHQLMSIGADAQLCVSYPGFTETGPDACEIRCYRGQIELVKSKRLAVDSATRWPFVWQGETQIVIAPFGGTLTLTPAAAGVPSDWLRTQSLFAQLGPGSTRLKPDWRRPTRSLRHHYQALGIPAWQRSRLPLIMTATHVPVFAAGIGTDCRAGAENDVAGDFIEFGWQPGEVGDSGFN